LNNVLLASPSDAATGFFGRLPGSSFAEDGCHYCSGAQKKAASWPPSQSQSAQDSTAAPDLAQEARVFGLVFGNSRDPVVSFFNGFKAF